ncbi:MAG: cytochrome c biogenesis protein CcsA [Acidimicrobiales bacterium]
MTVPVHTGSRGTRVLGCLATAGIASLLLFGLVLSPEDVDQADAVRLMYIHVPSAIIAYLAFFVTAAGSIGWLWKRSQWWDLVAAGSAEIGTLFTGVTLLTGMAWGKPIWGTFWTWDARLTSTALLFLMFLGYVAVRRLGYEPAVRNRRSAFVALIAVLDVPIVHYSVDWWRGLHQQATISRLDPTIDGLMLFTLMLGIAVFGLVYLWLLVHRFRVGWLEDQAEARWLGQAIEERRAEASATVEVH